jgi:hypothetical protein
MKQVKLSFVVSSSLTLCLVITLFCSQPSTMSVRDKEESRSDTVKPVKGNHPLTSIQPGSLFTLADAEKILGEPAHLTDSLSTTKGVASKYAVNDSVSAIKKDASTYGCAYKANSEDKKTGKTGIVYFLFEQYPHVASAKTVYSFYKRANENNPGFKELHGLGDEAWFGSSPLFVYVRKGEKIFVMKVNKMTSMTSVDEFNLIAVQITAAL